MHCEDALDAVCDEAIRQGASHFDVVAGESESLGLDLYEGKIKNTELSSSRGMGIRLFANGRPGYAFTEKFSLPAIRQCVTDAMGHTKITDPLEVELPQSQPLPELDLGLWSDATESIDLDAMKQWGLGLEARALEMDPKIENIPYLSVGRGSGRSWLRNSMGVNYAAQSNSLSAGLGVVAHENGSRKMGVYFNSANELSELDPAYMAQTAVKRALALLGASPVSSGQYPVLLSNRISARLMSMYASPFYADVVQKGQSKLEGKMGKSIAVPEFNLVCHPHLKKYPGSQLWDSEGILPRPCDVVRDGVLKTYLYNLESAKKEGRTSTGHAARGYSGQAGTGFSNYIVEKGEDTLEDLLGRYPACLYVTNLEGGAGCSATSGDISIGTQGFWIEGGQIMKPVEGVTISSNFFDLLKSIRGLSNEYSDVVSSTKVPDLLIESMYIAG